jgi:hypothetical protein
MRMKLFTLLLPNRAFVNRTRRMEDPRARRKMWTLRIGMAAIAVFVFWILKQI